MASSFFVALITGEILITAFEFNGDYINGRMVMLTSGLMIDRSSHNGNSRNGELTFYVACPV